MCRLWPHALHCEQKLFFCWRGYFAAAQYTAPRRYLPVGRYAPIATKHVKHTTIQRFFCLQGEVRCHKQ